jgi:hypothetical protein
MHIHERQDEIPVRQDGSSDPRHGHPGDTSTADGAPRRGPPTEGRAAQALRIIPSLRRVPMALTPETPISTPELGIIGYSA